MEENIEEELDEIEEDYEPVEPIEIEEGMPEDVKEAIARFNKRTAILADISNGTSSVQEDNEEDDSEYDDYEDDDETEEVLEDDSSDIIEEDDSEEIGDLF